MIHQCRLHLSLPRSEADVQRENVEPALDSTAEQAAILDLLDRVRALEARIAGAGDG